MRSLLLVLLLLPRAGSLNATAASGGLFICTTACGAANGTQLSASVSSFNAALALALGASPAPLPASAFMLLDASASAALSFIALSGPWAADEALYIPRQVVIALADGAELAATAQLAAAAKPGSVVFANGSYSALVAPGGVAGGARVACGGLPLRGIYALGAGGFVLDGVTVEECGGSADNCTGAVHLVGAPFTGVAEVARSRIVGGCRGIWLQMYSRVVIHHCAILNSLKFGVDWDSYAGPGLVWANTVTGAGYDGVFIEQGATHVTVVDNVIGGGIKGVSVYPYQWGASPTAQHVIAGNNVSRCKYAFATGSTKNTGNSTAWLPAAYVTYVGNSIDASNEIGFHANGPQTSTVYLSNSDAVGFGATALALAGSAVAIDPLGRARRHTSASAAPTPSRPPTQSATQSRLPTRSPSPSPSGTASPSPSGTASPSPSGTASPAPPAAAEQLPSGSPTATAVPASAPSPAPACSAAAEAAAAAAVAASAGGGSGGGAATCPSAVGVGAGAGVAGLALGFAMGALACRRRSGGGPSPLASAAGKGAAAASGGAALATTANPLAALPRPAAAAPTCASPPPAVRWVRVTEDGLEFCEREDGTGERVWEEDLPEGAVVVA